MTSPWWMLGAAGAGAAGGAAAGTAAGSTLAAGAGLGAGVGGGTAAALGGASSVLGPASMAGTGIVAPAASAAAAPAAALAPALGGASSVAGPASLNTALPAFGGGSAPSLGAQGAGGLGSQALNLASDASDWVYNPMQKVKQTLAGKGTNQLAPKSPGENLLGNVLSMVSLTPEPYHKGAPTLPSQRKDLAGMNPQVPQATGQFQMGPNGFLRYVGPGAA